MRIAIALLALLLFCCAPPRRATIPPPTVPPPKPPPLVKRVQYGWASWYGREFHGRRTASGQIYNMYDLTAAHPTLPLGTRVMVTHLKKGRSVVVTVNDRGPFVKGRIIDLSYAAARMLDMVQEGVAWVRVEVLSWPGQPLRAQGRGFTVQVGAFSRKVNALKLKEELSRVCEGVYITVLDTGQGRYWRVRVGSFPTREEAQVMAERLSSSGYDVLIMPQ